MVPPLLGRRCGDAEILSGERAETSVPYPVDDGPEQPRGRERRLPHADVDVVAQEVRVAHLLAVVAVGGELVSCALPTLTGTCPMNSCRKLKSEAESSQLQNSSTALLMISP